MLLVWLFIHRLLSHRLSYSLIYDFIAVKNHLLLTFYESAKVYGHLDEFCYLLSLEIEVCLSRTACKASFTVSHHFCTGAIVTIVHRCVFRYGKRACSELTVLLSLDESLSFAFPSSIFVFPSLPIETTAYCFVFRYRNRLLKNF